MNRSVAGKKTEWGYNSSNSRNNNHHGINRWGPEKKTETGYNNSTNNNHDGMNRWGPGKKTEREYISSKRRRREYKNKKSSSGYTMKR
ncbi:probable serine/threonine-protein kinase DDB_G0286481 [Scylla paramamosain]|uniref:probable serine/threonine-protein kinase DDB_G0286481 n=1 Tax=Scylla paramamosain TaxID=85552 RepID=UPI003083C11E